jgi:BASS family bile acid:Na+ symporter
MELVGLMYTKIIPWALILMMIGMGLSLTPADIRRVIVYPKAVTIGLVGQLLLLPALALMLAWVLTPAPAVAAGALILAACPGGMTSNAYVFAARADAALSVTLTAIASFITVFTIPFLTYLALNLYFDQHDVPELPALQMMKKLASLTILPIVVGMLVRRAWPGPAARAVEALRRVTLALIIVLIGAALIATFDTVLEHLAEAGVLMASLNISSMLLGYLLACGFGLSVPQRVTITYELGVQNIALAFLVTLTILDNVELSIPILIYAGVMKVSALSFMAIARNSLAKSPDSASTTDSGSDPGSDPA